MPRASDAGEIGSAQCVSRYSGQVAARLFGMVSRSPGAQVAGNPHQAGDVSRFITPRQFSGQTPAGLTAHIPMQLQPINDGDDRAQDGFVLIGIAFGKLLGKYRARAARSVPASRKTTALDERLVHRDIMAALILDEEHGFWHMIEELLDHRQQGERVRGRQPASRFFASMSDFTVQP